MNTAAVPLVVGAGPTGLSAALGLAQAGIRPRIIDRLRAPTNQSRAAILHARTLEMFQRLGIVEDFLAAGVRVHGAAIYDARGRLLTRPNLDQLPTPFPFMIGLEQSETERLLTRRLAELGVRVERGTELIGLTAAADAVGARLRDAEGEEWEVTAPYLIGADGARSAVREALGLKLEGETLDATWITADVKIRWDRPNDEAVAFLSPEGFAFIAPMNADRWRVIVNVPKLTPEQAKAVTLADVEALVRERFGVEAPMHDCVWLSPFSINTRLAPILECGRVFLAGDAAHVHSPIGGQGMNTGIQDALNLAWKLALVLRGEAREELLHTYEPERHANAERLLRTVGPATKMMNLRHPVTVELRNTVIHAMAQLGLTATVARTFSMLTVGYPDSPGVEDHRHGWHDRGPRAGERAPDAPLTNDRDEELTFFRTWAGDSRHQLLLFPGPNPAPARLAELRAVAAELGERPDFLRALVLDHPVDPNGEAHLAYDALEETAYLVRPDGYIGFRSAPVDAATLRAYIARWFPVYP